jgi:hypothetical protein
MWRLLCIHPHPTGLYLEYDAEHLPFQQTSQEGRLPSLLEVLQTFDGNQSMPHGYEGQQTMTGSQLPQDEIELRLATTVAPMLIAVGTFSLTLMANRPNPEKTYADEVFMGLGLLSITAAAFLVDFIFDHLQQDWPKRLFVMNGGYLFFSLVMGFISLALFFCTIAKVAHDLSGPLVSPSHSLDSLPSANS